MTEGYLKYIGWDQTFKANKNIQMLVHPENLKRYQARITHILKGVHPEGRPIVVPIDTIEHVIFKCYEAHRPQVGSIYSRYIQKSDRSDIELIIEDAISRIVNQIKTEYGTIKNNNSLTIWTTLYGDFNQNGLRAHSSIKVRNTGNRGQIHMRY